MSLFRIAAILLIAAIANPLCCCYATPTQTEKAVSHHGCCEVSKGESNESKQAQQHNPDNCQHMAEKDAQISQSADGGDSLLKSVHSLVLDLPAFLETSELDSQTKSSPRANFASLSIPEPPLAQAYCVYLL